MSSELQQQKSERRRGRKNSQHEIPQKFSKSNSAKKSQQNLTKIN